MSRDRQSKRIWLSRTGICLQLVTGNVDRFYSRSKPYGCIISISNREDYNKIIANEFVSIGTSTVPVTRHTFVKLCDRCCGLGHSAEDCVLPADLGICILCNSTKHTVSMCKEVHETNGWKVVPQCHNCKVRGTKNYRHYATAYFCPYRRDFI